MTPGDVVPTGTGQACNAFFLRAEVNAEKVGDHLVHFHAVYGTPTGLHFAGDQLLGKRATTGRATSAAIGVGQQGLDLINAWVFKYRQATVGHDQDGSQDQSETGHEADGDQDISKR